MPNQPARFVWYELITTDPQAAISFYKAAIGWDAQDFEMADLTYTILSAGPERVGGLMPIPEEARAMGVPPCWTGYIAVDDVDAYVTRVTAAGGALRRAAQDIPDVGRFAVVADPHGAVFILFKGSSDQGPTPAAPDAPGHVGWHELHAGDLDSAFAFYSGLFGWTKGDAIQTQGGPYQMFSAGGAPIGGMMKKMPQTPGPFWLYYFIVDEIDAAMKRVTDGGGQNILGPLQVPGGIWIANCVDPQGAMFAISGPKR
ncbi:MAG: VOC family protein [Acetobacteraceae bacterium]|nr:VOC family protein [Acetobacteraceae bacterium]